MEGKQRLWWAIKSNKKGEREVVPLQQTVFLNPEKKSASDSALPTKSPSNEHGQQFFVTEEYEAQGSNELTLEVAQTVVCLATSGDGK